MNFASKGTAPQVFDEGVFGSRQTEYGIPDIMSAGVGSTRGKITPSHPLELSEKEYVDRQHRLDMTVLRNTQGLYAPLQIAAELKAVRSVGRLPFLASSNLAAATLLGEDDTIGFNDFLSPLDFSERLVNPHMLMERRLGIL